MKNYSASPIFIHNLFYSSAYFLTFLIKDFHVFWTDDSQEERIRHPRMLRPCPFLRFDCSRMPNVCANMRNAIRNRGKPMVLNRITSRSQIRRNRRLSGCTRMRNPPGFSCDEYPFASSSQGGRFAVIRSVPAVENNRQGGQISSFYRTRGIMNGDCYTVIV